MTSSRPEKQVKPLHPYQAAMLEALLEGDQTDLSQGPLHQPGYASLDQIDALFFPNSAKPSEQPSNDSTT